VATLLRRRSGNRGHLLAHAVLMLGALLILLPLTNLVLMSFMSLPDMAASPIGLPPTWQFNNYADAWNQGNLGQYLVNTAIVALISVAGILLCSSLAAYVLARYKFRGNTAVYLLFLAGYALPIQLIAVPVFVMMKNLNLIDNLGSVILIYTAGGMPFSIFLLVNYFRTLPTELEEAARLEGANEFQIYAYIDMPLARPALTTVALFNFVGAWNGLFFPLILLADQNKMTVTVGVLSFIGQYEAQWNLILPALIIIMIPTLLVFALASGQFIRGLTAGAVK
jgi:raffinose/stachyose/melibiose transport system permease protein